MLFISSIQGRVQITSQYHSIFSAFFLHRGKKHSSSSQPSSHRKEKIHPFWIEYINNDK